MTIRRDDGVIFLEAICGVEDADALLQELQAGTALIDWTSCSYLHTACLQLILAARVPVRGPPADAELGRWVAPLMSARGAPDLACEADQQILIEV